MLINHPDIKCPLTLIEEDDGKYEVRLSRHIWHVEAEYDCDLEGGIGDGFGITVQDTKTFEKLDGAIEFANEVSDFMHFCTRNSMIE